MQNIINQLNNITQFLGPLLTIIDSHMNDFLTKNLWETVLTKNLQQDLIKLEVIDILNWNLNSEKIDLNGLVYEPHEFGLIKEHFESEIERFNQFMSPKKAHEVVLLSEVVRTLSLAKDCENIVDIGDGKGYVSSFICSQYNLNVLGLDSCGLKTKGAAKRLKKIQKCWKVENVNDEVTREYKQVTCKVTLHTDIPSIVSKNFPSKNSRIGIIGLHTCGNLSPISLKHFVNNNCFKFIVNIGCCYHLLDEEEKSLLAFPMSDYLKTKKFNLSRNARMLALQAKCRLTFLDTNPSDALFYRAVLEKILEEKFGANVPQIRVGRLFSKTTSFYDYVETALRKGNLDLKVTEEEAESYFTRYSTFKLKLEKYFIFRASFSTWLELVILLDRLLWLKEMGVTDSYLVKLFDPVISPRCHAILAWRSV